MTLISEPVATQDVTVPRRVLGGGSGTSTVLAPVAFGVVFLGLWQLLVTALHVDTFLLPAPSAIAAEFFGNLDTVLAGSLRTGANALVGLAVGTVVGVLAAVVASLWRTADALGAPLVAALAVMPIVALAPVLYTMYGADVETARQLVAALAVLIPVYLNTLRGLRQVRPVHRDLMRAYAATARQQQLAVTLPTAAPYLFTGLRIASSLAVISALVAEYFGGPVGGLGKSITSAASSSNYPLAWAYVLGAIGLGLLFYCAALAVESWSTRHRPS
ncbi:ABC transporter permease [uncultured Friedmanniella sp.]|uniref:ABC transporter permease n=1 Tax=uncultured Friedmanniella sp. TaxID=335381 RepID=UPI0035CC14B3